jgi:hypothetical protein
MDDRIKHKEKLKTVSNSYNKNYFVSFVDLVQKK